MSEKYRNISVKTEFANAIERFVNNNPEYGYRSIAQFLEDAARDRLEQLKGLGPEPSVLSDFNLDENGVRILDRSLATEYSPNGRIIDVYFKEGKVWCDYCQTSDCRHTQYALTIPKVREILRKKGWKL